MGRCDIDSYSATIYRHCKEEDVRLLVHHITLSSNTIFRVSIWNEESLKIVEEGVTHPNSEVEMVIIKFLVTQRNFKHVRSILTCPNSSLISCTIENFGGVNRDTISDFLYDIVSDPNCNLTELNIPDYYHNIKDDMVFWFEERNRNRKKLSMSLFQMCTEKIVYAGCQLPIPILTMCVENQMGREHKRLSVKMETIVNHLLHLLNNI